MKRARITAMLVCGLALAAAACNSSTARLMPTAPSPVVAANPQAVASLFGDDASSGSATHDRSAVTTVPDEAIVRDASAVARWAATAEGWDVAQDLNVSGSGPVTAVSGTCPEKTLTIYGIEVYVTPATSYSLGSACSGLVAGRIVRVTGLLFVSGGVTQVLASKITIEGGVNTPVSGEGVVTSISGCPLATMVVRGVSITVGAGAQVKWKDGKSATCEDIKVGMLVKIDGEVTPEQQVFASKITLPANSPSGSGSGGGSCDGSDGGSCGGSGGGTGGGSCDSSSGESCGGSGGGGGTNNGEHVSGSGVVATVKGSCPSITFTLFGQTVKTDTSTTFSGGKCKAVKTGTFVKVEGYKKGSWISATKVKIGG